jgi:hypothetical protein
VSTKTQTSLTYPRQCGLCRKWISSASAQIAHEDTCRGLDEDRKELSDPSTNVVDSLGQPSKRWVEVIELTDGSFQMQWRTRPDVEQSSVTIMPLVEVDEVSAGFPGVADAIITTSGTVVSGVDEETAAASNESFTIHTKTRQVTFRAPDRDRS